MAAAGAGLVLYWSLAVLGLGYATMLVWLTLAGAILIAHIGVDRLAGYGLKYPTSFQDTHLGRIGQRARPWRRRARP